MAPLLLLLLCAVSLSERLSITELQVESPYTMIGQTETIHCVCRNGSLPITYTLFLNQTAVDKKTATKERGATFTVTIYNETRLGPYKCKGNNSLTYIPYSAGFTFIPQEMLSKMELQVESPYTIIGQNETIHCVCRNGSLPITYTLFLNQTAVDKKMATNERGATFTVTIYNETRLGPYKCKANNSLNNTLYTAGLTYIPQDRLLQVDLSPGSLHTMIGQTETIHCTCGNGSFPITYTLTLNGMTVEEKMVTKERGAAFTVTIYDETRLGPYKCKANNSLQYAPHSAGFSFTLQGQRTRHGYLAWLIPILILTAILVIIVWVIFTRRKKGMAECPQDQYCAVDPVYEIGDGIEIGEDEDVAYCTMVIREGSGAIMKAEETVEYAAVSKR
ncbi:Fc receptor-like protein 5 [Anomaloglossus baeobatrachus]|uniref:Fc receptor-like protein 5 n=1 Tax=Anomaloglossus baeobatrachus TaxID=238106 RepID=UPI003F4FCEE8